MGEILGGGAAKAQMRQQAKMQQQQLAEARRQQLEERRVLAERGAETGMAERAQRALRAGRSRRGLLAYVGSDEPVTLG